MESIFGKFYYNKNLAIELSKFLTPESLSKLVKVSKKFRSVYSQDIIWWIFLYNSFPSIK